MPDDLKTPPRNHNSIRTEIVTSYEQLLHAYAIRAVCFMEEHGVKATQTFDGNDYQATHAICYVNDEPAGTIRIRWFKDFAKMERASFRADYRDVRVIKACGEFIFSHIARKGYNRVITHALPQYARMWRMLLGFKTVEGKVPVQFEGHGEPYVELVKDLQPPADAITSDTDAAVLFRIEGAWDRPSAFEAER